MSDQNISGAHAVGVQIDGNHNHVQVIVGQSGLTLERLHLYRQKPKTVLELLRADIRAINLIGREDILRDLAGWRDADSAIAVRCLIGRAGAGKTRLAIEACEAAEALGWKAGFVRSEDLRRFNAFLNIGEWQHVDNTLLVIDYASASADILKSWFENLAPYRDQNDRPKLRILLLERQATPESGWWHDILQRTSMARPMAADLIGTEMPIMIPQRLSVEQRRDLLSAAMTLAAPLLGKLAISPPSPGQNTFYDERLSQDCIDNEPLYLLMAGVHAVNTSAPEALALGKIDLVYAMASIERARITKLATSLDFSDKGDFLAHLAACITLRNGCSWSSLEAIVQQEADAMRVSLPGGLDHTISVISELLNSNSVGPDAIRPDVIGEAFFTTEIIGQRTRPIEKQHGVVSRALSDAEFPVITTLIRTAQDLALGKSNHPAVDWLSLAVKRCASASQLWFIAGELPENTLALRELAVSVQGRLVELSRLERDLQPNLQNTANLALAVNNYSNRLRDIGRLDEAFHAIAEAIDLRRVLSDARPDLFISELAMSLLNFVDCANEVGRPAEGLTAGEEALRLYRQLVSYSSNFVPYLATTLSNVTWCLTQLGRPKEALNAMREAVDLYRGLAKISREKFLPGLATALNNLSNQLAFNALLKNALEASSESVYIRRHLAALQPDAYRPDFASSLNNYSNRLGEVGQWEDALAAIEEAVQIYRDLSASRPDAFLPDLTMALRNLTKCLIGLDRWNSALVAVEELIELERQLVAAQPNMFMFGYASSLGMYADCLEMAGRAKEALIVNHEALKSLKQLFSENPRATADLMAPILRKYISRSNNDIENRDHTLIDSVLRVFQQRC